ncbi:MAG: protein kinase [Planctomycetes bacterium]|nr:protein kinase [Planctomycetota bacterium]
MTLPDHVFNRLRRLATEGLKPAENAGEPEEVYAARRAGGEFGKFVLLEELGRGGMGVVRRAWQQDLRREVALKMVATVHPELRERFLHEARTGARLTHPSLLPVYEAGEQGGTLWLAMPLVRGVTLDKASLGPVEAARAMASVARAAHAAHEQGVLHRDIKPTNVMKDSSGVYLMDLGLARPIEAGSWVTQGGDMVGTPMFMAPEQLLGGGVDRRTDVYGLGATLYALVAGRAPWAENRIPVLLVLMQQGDPPPPSRLRPVARDLETVILKAMDRDPSRRYPTAAALAEDLERFLRGEPVDARRLPWPVRAARSARRRGPFLLTAVALVALAAGIWLSVRQKLREESQRDLRAAQEILKSAEDLRGSKKYEAAIPEYTRTISRDPSLVAAWSGRAECLLNLDRWQEASSDLDQAFKLDPRRPGDRLLRGQCFLWMGNPTRAAEEFSVGIALQPESAELRVSRSHARYKAGDFPGSREDADATLRLNPADSWALLIRGQLNERDRRFEDALRDLDAAMSISPGAVTLVVRGRVKRALNDAAGAIKDFKDAIALGGEWKVHAEEELAATKPAGN